MNWYKKAQQQYLEFYKNIPEQKRPPIENPKESDDMSLQDMVENSNSLEQLGKVLNAHGLEWEKIDFHNGESIISVKKDGNVYIIDDFNYPEMKDANKWIWNIYNLEQYLPQQDFNENFWNEVTNGSKVYHATVEENKGNILRNGLRKENKSRGISNRSTGSAVFTSDNPDDISSYGNVIFEIDLGKMKQDGYMPEVSKEEPLSDYHMRDTLANMIGLENFIQDDYGSEGIYDSTIIIYGNIPPKYLKIFSE